MIRLENLTKSYFVNGACHVVFDRVSMTLQSGQSLALLGRNGSGKSTLLQILAGNLCADSGMVRYDGTVSWPVGFAGPFIRT